MVKGFERITSVFVAPEPTAESLAIDKRIRELELFTHMRRKLRSYPEGNPDLIRAFMRAVIEDGHLSDQPKVRSLLSRALSELKP